uniref:ATPREP1 (PRESEQUENCE PROTEASE 1) n=1 Tax=Arundo donax TaxID=35708 RepID=A0A0A9EL92_ARUDO
MVVLTMELLEFFKSKLWDFVWIPTTVDPISVLREKCLLRHTSHYVIGLRINSFHFIEDNTFVCYLVFRVIELIVPTFLLKCLEVLNTFREKDGIKVYIYQVVEILGVC